MLKGINILFTQLCIYMYDICEEKKCKRHVVKGNLIFIIRGWKLGSDSIRG